MKVDEVVRLTQASVITGQERVAQTEIIGACGADLLSDVLAFVKDQGMLITGLINPQVVRTAETMDMKCILFVRGKQPDETTVQIASQLGIILLSTEMTMFNACGVLYCAGILAGRKCNGGN